MRTKVRSSCGILFLLVTALLVFPIEESLAATIAVTRSNLAHFSQPNKKVRHACYLRTQRVRAGTITSKTVVVGTRWTELSVAKLEKVVRALQRQVAQAKSAVKRKSLSKQLHAAQTALKAFQRTLELCALARDPVATPTPSGPEFLGSASSLEPYRESITSNEINHILNKVAFGGSDTLRTIGRTQGLTALVNALVDGVGISQTETKLQSDANFWADTLRYVYDEHPQNRVWTTEAAQVGQTYRLFFSEHPFKEWMTLFWSAHFAININLIDASYSQWAHRSIPEYWDLLRQEAFGNFRDLTQSMVTDSAMCAWLNNDDNRADSPNQNFAREFLELFTLGAVDPSTGTSNYSEEGIAAATGYFSGFYEDSVVNPSSGVEERVVRYDEASHDSTARTVFRGIAGAEFSGSMDWDQFPNYVLDHHPGAPRYMVERLFAQMVNPNVSEAVIQSLAAEFKSNNYELKPTLRRILKSEAMFSATSRQVCINSPIELFTRLTRRLLKIEPSRATSDIEGSRWFFQTAVMRAGNAGQSIFEPPSVFAWKGACGLNRSGAHAYGEGWITAQSLLNRFRGCTDLMNSLSDQGFNFRSVLPPQATTAAAITQSLASSLFDLTLTSEETADLVKFLTREKDPDSPTGYKSLRVDLEDDYYVQRKIPRAICLLFDLEVSNEK